jgi:hypothetical protein
MAEVSAISRVAKSQKNQVVVVGLSLLAAASEQGFRDVVVEMIAALTALAVGVQGALDWKWGSKSDGTGKFGAQANG